MRPITEIFNLDLKDPYTLLFTRVDHWMRRSMKRDEEISALRAEIVNMRESAAKLCFEAWRESGCDALHEVGVRIQTLPLTRPAASQESAQSIKDE